MYIHDTTRKLEIVDYTYEVWDWKTGKYIADITNVMQGSVSISWTLNDIEQMSFTVDLAQLERKCKKMGVKVEDVLTPYVHDIRVRRNGDYILGVQVVETTIQINTEAPTIEVKCTGFLNLFKDSYFSAEWKRYTYPQMACKIVNEAQSGDNLIKNGCFDIDTEGWIVANGTLNRVAGGSPQNYLNGEADMNVICNSGSNWGTAAARHYVGKNGTCIIEFDGGSRNNVTLAVRTRANISDATGQSTLGYVNYTNGYNHYKIGPVNVRADQPYVLFEANDGKRGDFWIDNIRMYRARPGWDDSVASNDMKVRIGMNGLTGLRAGDWYFNANNNDVVRASNGMDGTRERTYDLQNAKEALQNLTRLEKDNFDFWFEPNRTMRIARRKGAYKPEVEVSYPGNVSSGSITRSAADLYTKARIIGSGIGDERIEGWYIDNNAINKYGMREYVATENDVKTLDVLFNKASGQVSGSNRPTNLPQFTVEDGSINPGNCQVGDTILIKMYGDEYLETTTGMYHIVQYDLSISEENQESVDLTVEPDWSYR